jgi:hypothetical protein
MGNVPMESALIPVIHPLREGAHTGALAKAFV